MKILITGSAGHLGEALCRTLQDQGVDYVGMDIKAGPFTTHQGSITDVDLVNSMMDGVDYVLHTATLHKPHVATHSKQAFIDTNITGTLVLLEAAHKVGVKGFIFTSTTSTFGDQLRPAPDQPAVWVTEELVPIPKNIYGVTKIAAEDLCQLFYRNHQLPCLVLKTSRFFMEPDDNRALREEYADLNLKANEYLHRRVDVEDIVTAHLLAIEKVETLGFEKYIISATPPFTQEHLQDLHQDAPSMVRTLFPIYETLYAACNWRMFPTIGRVYDNTKAREELGWEPKYNFAYVLNALQNGQDFRSPLSVQTGIKGYHDVVFKDGPYPVEE